MSEPFKFSRARIDHHIEKVGVDVRPPIEIGMEKDRVMTFFNQVSEQYPDLFETLSFSRTELSIQKRFEFPGKGQADVKTFSLTKRGPVFTFPRMFSELDGAEMDFEDIDAKVVEILKLFCKTFPQTQILRVGKVHEYIFHCEGDSVEYVARHFTRLSGVKEVFVRFNLESGGLNRNFQIQPVVKQQRSVHGTGEPVGFGVSVSVDCNNEDMSKPLEWTIIAGILSEARSFHETKAFDILNNLGEE